MKYIKKNLQVVEPEINDEGYYVVGNVVIHPDIFHQQYQPLGFTLTAEEVEMLEMDILPDSIEEYGTHGQWSLDKLKFCKKLLNRINKYKDETTD